LLPTPTTHSAPSHLLSSPSPHLSFPLSVTRLHTHHLRTNLLYQIYTTPKSSNP
jgi:hypothetical protein